MIFLEPKALYRGAEDMVPVQDYELELHVAEVVKEGTDITLIGWGAQMRVIMEVKYILKFTVIMQIRQPKWLNLRA